MIESFTGRSCRLPDWDQIQGDILSRDLLKPVKSLEQPRLLVSPEGTSFSSLVEKAANKDLPRRLPVFDYEHLLPIVTSSMKEFAGLRSDLRFTIPQRLRGHRIGYGPWAVTIVDGGDEVPASTLGFNAWQILTLLSQQKVEAISPAACHLLQLLGRFREKPFDQEIGTFLNAFHSDHVYFPDGYDGDGEGGGIYCGMVLTSQYIKSLDAITFIDSNFNSKHGDIGVRRAIRVMPSLRRS